MILFAHLNLHGIPTGGGSRRALPDGAVELPPGYDTADLPRLIYVDGAWQERPQLPQPVITAQGVEVTGLPQDAVLTALRLGSDDRWQEPGKAGAARLSLPENGTFEVIVQAPLPWLGRDLVIVRGTGSPELVADRLAQAKDVGVARVNEAIGNTRRKYITDIPGQGTIYTEKQAEARAYLTAVPLPASLVDYPLLAAEIGVTAPTAWQLAQVWANKAVLFKYVAAITEKLRMEASFAIDAAADEAAVDAAVTASLTTLFKGPLG